MYMVFQWLGVYRRGKLNSRLVYRTSNISANTGKERGCVEVMLQE